MADKKLVASNINSAHNKHIVSWPNDSQFHDTCHVFVKMTSFSFSV